MKTLSKLDKLHNEALDLHVRIFGILKNKDKGSNEYNRVMRVIIKSRKRSERRERDLKLEYKRDLWGIETRY